MNLKKLFPDLEKDQLSKIESTLKKEVDKIKDDYKSKYDSIKSNLDDLNNQVKTKDKLLSKLGTLTSLNLDNYESKDIEQKIEEKINEGRSELEKKESLLNEYEKRMKTYENIIKDNNKQLLDKELISQINSNLNNYPVKDRDFVTKHLNMFFKTEYEPEYNEGKLILKDGKTIDQVIGDMYNSEKENDKYILFSDNIKDSGPSDDSEVMSIVNVNDQNDNYKEDIYTIS